MATVVQKCPDKVLYVKSRRGKVVRIVREHYVRNDIYCQSKICRTCKHANPVLPGPEETNHYLVVDIETLVTFLELFEQPEFHNVILAQTIITEIQDHGSLKVLGRIRDLANDARRNFIIFGNENFASTWTQRNHQSLDARNQTAVIRLAAWYQEHLGPKSPVHIVFVSENETVLERASKEAHVKPQRLGQYLQNYLPKHPDLYELYESLAAVAEEDESAEGATPTGYEEYKPDDVIESGVKSGMIYRGKLQVGRYSSDEAWVRLEEKSSLGRDIVLSDKVCRNRAFHGDIVAVELLDQRRWSKPDTPCGRVVGIIQRNWRPYVCTIQEEDVLNSKGDKQEWVIAVPWDSKIPKIRIKTRQVKEIGNARIVVRADRWDVDSNYPQGHYVRTLGEIGKLETEMQVLLQENGVQSAPHSANMLAELPEHTPERPWRPDPAEVAKRRDCRSWRVCSIDPLGSQDIDDALSVNILPNGNYEVGCHIADVTAFVKEGSLLDAEAMARSTSVYLADRRIDMLPALLSETLCSIRQRQDRYAMSCIWTFDKDANIVDTWFGRTLINSKYEFHYQQAQDIIDGSDEQKKVLGGDYDIMRGDLLILRDLFRILREKRLAKGALELESVEIRFELDGDKKPVGIKTKQELEVNSMVAEYMILANVSVAKFIYDHFPESSLLRRHPLPRNDSFQEMMRLAQLKGFQIDTSSNRALAQSLSKAVLAGDRTFNRLLKSLATLAMSEAEYFSTGSFERHDFYHYGLAAEYYTHFTSPIRRYADVLVHRVLQAALDGATAPVSNSTLQQTAQHINEKHRQSKQVQRDSTELFEVLYFRDHQNVVEDSVVFSFRKDGFMVYIPKFGIKAPLRLRDDDGKVLIPLDALTGNGGVSVVDFESSDEANSMILKTSAGGRVAIDALDHVTVRIRVQESRAHMPPIKLELVKFGNGGSTTKSTAAGSKAAPVAAPINLKQAVIQDQLAAEAEAAEELRRRTIVPEYMQTEESKSLYTLVDQFDCLSISPNVIAAQARKQKVAPPTLTSLVHKELEGVLIESATHRAPPTSKKFREQLQIALANAGLLRHHDALQATGRTDEYAEEEYYDEEEEEYGYQPPGSAKVVPGAQKAASSPAAKSAPPPSSSTSAPASDGTAAPAAAPKKQFTPFRAKGFVSGAGNVATKPNAASPALAGGQGAIDQAAARGESDAADKLKQATKAVEGKYKDTIKKAEQELKSKTFQAFKAKKKY